MKNLPPLRLSELLSGLELADSSCAHGCTGDPLINDVAYDSRKVMLGSVFVAMQGGTTDGNRYVDAAIQQGAVAIVTDSRSTWTRLSTTHPELPVVCVPHGRRALATLSANLFRHPEDKLRLCGVTGTNGKTTTTFLLESMLRGAGRSCILVGTIEYRVAQSILPSPHTTPESRDLLELFADGVAAGVTEAVMEVSSHALEQGRVWGLHWDTAVFTNLTQDHLDYHGTMESYFQAKARIFAKNGAPAPRVAVIHSADEYGRRMIAAARASGCEIVEYGLDAGAFRAENIQLAANGTDFRLITPAGNADLHTHLPGPVNVLNLLAASAAAMARGLTLEEIAAGVESIAYVPGRFQTVNCGQPFTVAIDYAHTDDALRNLTRLARRLVAARNGRVITVFGCGGDRDRTKRPRMGRAAGEGSDFVVVTSDNPRTEGPEAIIAEILPGLAATGVRFAVEADRAHAIELAIAEARETDVVLIAGKGHEKVQILRDRTITFDDAEQSRQALLRRLGDADSNRGTGLKCN